MSELIEAQLTWNGSGFVKGLRVSIGDAGRILAVGSEAQLPGAARELPGRALMPGLVNAHSHAFQRGLRGQGERFPFGAGSFWSWREAMYGLVDEMDPESMHALSLRAFREMLAAGFTSVGEFHYLHHAGDDRGWDLDAAVLAAAKEAGIRIVLLQAYYETGGIEQPLLGAQVRFGSKGPAEYWTAMDRLAPQLDLPTQSLGCVIHSIRAAGLESLRAVHAESKARGLVCHMHLEEQPLEIEDCMAAYARTPMGVLLSELDLDERFCAVHCTHTDAGEMRFYLERGANVCICPLTEANLGDGIADLNGFWSAASKGTQLSIGSDSNARISAVEELRLFEYGQRLKHQGRGQCLDAEGQVAAGLLKVGTAGGARALGLEAGKLEAGHWADLVCLDLAANCLEGWEADTLLESWIFGAGNEAIAEVCVGGRWVR
jgi:formimidoylglutamate deiminase